MNSKINNINIGFIDFFTNKNYKLEKSVKITSGIDPSVFFVGSTISVLKPLLLNDNIDSTGNIAIQNAIRSRALNRIYIPEKIEWSSYFDAIGLLVNYNNIDNIIGDVLEYLNNKADISYQDIQININSKDVDLVKSLENVNPGVKVQFDTKPEAYYKHRYGLDDLGIYGRNMNIAIKDKSDNIYKDIGNIIVIESKDKKYGVEYGSGVNSMIMRTEGIDTSIEASTVADIVTFDSLEKYKFADCLSVVSHLASEDIETMFRKSRSLLGIYRKYLRALDYWREKLNISSEQLNEMIKNYLLLKYNDYNEEVINYNLKLIKK